PDAQVEEGAVAAFIDSAVRTRAVIRASVPAVFRGDVLFFTAAGPPGSPAGADAWRPYVTGRIETHRVGCTHHEMVTESGLAEIGPILSRKLSNHPAGVPA